MKIRAVLWDFGGVLTTSPFDAFNRFEEQRGYPSNFIRSINATNPDHNAWAQLEAKRISVQEFDRAFAVESGAAGHAIRGADVLGLLDGEVRPRMVQVLERVKQDFRVACLTNNIRPRNHPSNDTDTPRTRAVEAVMNIFEHILESSVEGMRKPEPEFYRLACQRLQVAPEEVVYLDDLGINLKPARTMGMTTIKVVTEQQAITDLGRVLGIKF